MGTINLIRLARVNPLIARELEPTGPRDEFPFCLYSAVKPLDPYERRSNVARSAGQPARPGRGPCLCDD
jgi:hypothetical protein